MHNSCFILRGMEIKELRKKLKMTQQQLADELGVDIITVWRWEKGKIKPSRLAMRQLARMERKAPHGK